MHRQLQGTLFKIVTSASSSALLKWYLIPVLMVSANTFRVAKQLSLLQKNFVYRAC